MNEIRYKPMVLQPEDTKALNAIIMELPTKYGMPLVRLIESVAPKQPLMTKVVKDALTTFHDMILLYRDGEGPVPSKESLMENVISKMKEAGILQ